MNKDQVLPITRVIDVNLTPYTSGFAVGMAIQRDADWERVKALVGVLEILAEKGNYRGNMYSIPVTTWALAQAALAQLEAKP